MEERDYSRYSAAALTKVYLQLREAKAGIAKKAKEDTDKIVPYMTQIENELMRRMDKDQASSIKTTAGTPYISETITGDIVDYDAFMKFVKDNQRPDMLQKRLSLSIVNEYNEENPDSPVPGVYFSTIRRLNVRGGKSS